MPKEIPKQQEKPEVKLESVKGPVFATPEELKEKQQLLQDLKEVEQDKTLKGLEKQKDIYIKMEQLDQRRKQRIAKEKGEAVLGELPEKLKEGLRADVENFQKIYDLNGIKKKIELPTLTEEQVEKIKEVQEKDPHFELHYLPELEINENTKLPDDFTEFPNKMFKWLKENKIDSESLKLEEQYILIDNRPKPEHQDGQQLYEDDKIMEDLIKDLRNKGEIEHDKDYPIQSRNKTSYEDLKDKILPKYAKELNLKQDQTRLPKYIEFYMLGNLYHKKWGESNTYEWHDDRYGSSHALMGGDSDRGGLSRVDWDGRGGHWPDAGFRPLVVLKKEK